MLKELGIDVECMVGYLRNGWWEMYCSRIFEFDLSSVQPPRDADPRFCGQGLIRAMNLPTRWTMMYFPDYEYAVGPTFNVTPKE